MYINPLHVSSTCAHRQEVKIVLYNLHLLEHNGMAPIKIKTLSVCWMKYKRAHCIGD